MSSEAEPSPTGTRNATSTGASVRDPLRVFVGCEPAQIVPARVLEHSIRKFASVPVEIRTMLDLPIPQPRRRKNRARTGFSFYRFAIPALCGYRGRALYLDADMQVFGDVAELRELPFGAHTVLCTHQTRASTWLMREPGWSRLGRHTGVMLLDCSRLRWDVDEVVRDLDHGRYTYEELMEDLRLVPAEEIADTIPPEWNCLEYFEPESTKLVHYTHSPSNPWKTNGNPLSELWMTGYREAVRDGFLARDLVLDGIRAGDLKPSLATEL